MIRTATTRTATEPVHQRPAEWSDWRWQLRRAVTSAEQLARSLVLTDRERDGIARAGLSMLIPPYYLALCDPDDARCPIRLQCVPRVDEALRADGELADPLGEEAHEVAPELIRRYPDRALLIATESCAVYCRFCTRSRVVQAQRGVLPLPLLEPAFQYLTRHPEVRELIVSGGDPLVASTRRIARAAGAHRADPLHRDDPSGDARARGAADAH